MKKVSTGGTQPSRNISQQRLTIGLDLGDRNRWYCVVDEAGQIQLEQRVRRSAKALQEVFGAMPRSRVALETGTHSPWISRLLSKWGHEVIVANARKVRLIGESRKKDDRLDAQTLARLARIDPELLCPVKHRSAQAQADLAVIGGRAGLVRARTGLVNTARGLAKSYGERLRGCNVRNMNPEKAQGLSPELQPALEPLLSAIEELSQRIGEYNERIEALAQQSYPQVALRKQIKGVGIRSKIEAARSAALPSSALSKACQYALTLWKKLTRFLEDPELELSNNLAENSMRPIALGRKNWIHIGSPQAGPKVAAILSVVESCRRLRISVRAYVAAVLPGLADRPIRCLPDLTPAVWVTRHS